MSYDTNGSLDRALELAKKRWLFLLIWVEQAFKTEIQGNAVLEHWQRDRKREQRKEAPGRREGHPLENVDSQVLVANVLVLGEKIGCVYSETDVLCSVQYLVRSWSLNFILQQCLWPHHRKRGRDNRRASKIFVHQHYDEQGQWTLPRDTGAQHFQYHVITYVWWLKSLHSGSRPQSFSASIRGVGWKWAYTFCYWARPAQLGYCLFLFHPKPLIKSSTMQACHVVHIGHVQFRYAQRLAVQLGP